MPFVTEIRQTASVFLQNLDCGLPEIGCPINAIFLLDVFQREGAVVLPKIGGDRPMGCKFQQVRVIPLWVDVFPEIELSHLPVWKDSHDIADFVVA